MKRKASGGRKIFRRPSSARGDPPQGKPFCGGSLSSKGWGLAAERSRATAGPLTECTSVPASRGAPSSDDHIG